MLFQTSRLQVRLLTFDDFEPFHEMQGNFNVMRYTTGKAQSEVENQIDLKKVISHYSEPDNSFWVWAIDRKPDKAFLGTGALIVDKKNEGEIGYRFLEKYWGNGYGTEVMKGLIDYGFNNMNLNAIYAWVDILNVPSVKMLDKSILPFIKEEWNEEYQSQDRFYKLEHPNL